MAEAALSPLDELIRANLAEADAEPEHYRIALRHPGDPEAQGRLAQWHLTRIRREREMAASERGAIDQAIQIQEALLEALRRKRAAIDEQCEDRTLHDRRVIADWMREADHIRNGKRKSLDLGVARIGTRTEKPKEKVECDSDTLAGLFPDLTTPKLTDKREAMKRLRAEGGHVYVAETGELVEGATIETVPERVTVYAEFGPDRVVLEELTAHQALTAPEGVEDDGE